MHQNARVNRVGSTLTPTQKATARALWQRLMFAQSSLDLQAARQELKEACPEVRQIIINVIGQAWSQGKEPCQEENPFAKPDYEA